MTTNLRSALESLAKKWSVTFPNGGTSKSEFFGVELTSLLSTTTDDDLPVAAAALADNWGNAGGGVPDYASYTRGYFAFDVQQAIRTSATPGT
ncbi:hypothetical protein [Pseudarthrobacter oxydans]|uniref:hypothetical protein n=1 Tax=Pseudarthrobacter oxydans TaxID=1671 RepID=UPI001FE98855|nr:hypothetical protein [Pseudarthrobacter oxydans]